MASSILSRLKFIIGADNKQFLTNIQQSQKQIVAFQKNIQGFARFAGVAFGGIEIGQFLVDSARIAEQAKGIRIAFDALNRSNLLNNLRASVKDTVSDFDLMKAAVSAQQFRVPLDQLATFFEFARIRAASLGVEVDQLVQDIVTGIGRKSIRIIDNLGISAAELQEEIKKVGDFGQATANIIIREIGKAPATLKEVTRSTNELNAAWENFKLSVGQNTEGTLSNIRGFATKALRILSDPKLQEAILLATPGGVGSIVADGNARADRAATIAANTAPVATGSANSPFRINNQGLSNINTFRTQLVQIQLTAARLKNASLESIVPPPVIDRIANAQERLQQVKRLFEGSIGQGFRSESLNRIDSLDSSLQERFGASANSANRFNTTLSETLQLSGLLQQSFTSLFQSILDGGRSADDIFKGLFSILAGGLFNGFIGGLFGGGASASAGTSFVLSSGDIAVQSAISSRNRRFTR